MDNALEKNLAELESFLRQQLNHQEQMVALLQAKRVALASADTRRIAELCQQENGHLQALSEIEKKRLVLAGKITLMLDPKAPAPLRLGELAARLPEPARGRVLVLREQLRQRFEAARVEVGVAKAAAETLVRHMQGIVQGISTAVTGVNTYNRAGARPQASLSLSTFNTTA
ncbi:MAG: flagellar export chaperone FlgN [Planctomycetota bacterium]|nr:flagellar export chaperone FlgN [Planctomycetota bacterium]